MSERILMRIGYNEQEQTYYISTEDKEGRSTTIIPLKYVKSNKDMLKHLEEFRQWGINEEELHTLKIEDKGRFDSETKKGLCRVVGKINQDAKDWFPKNYKYID